MLPLVCLRTAIPAVPTVLFGCAVFCDNHLLNAIILIRKAALTLTFNALGSPPILESRSNEVGDACLTIPLLFIPLFVGFVVRKFVVRVHVKYLFSQRCPVTRKIARAKEILIDGFGFYRISLQVTRKGL